MEDFYKKYYFLTTDQLKNTFENGKEPIPSDLIGWEFRGVNIGIFTKLLGIRKFFKVFTEQFEEDAFVGYNLKAQQNKLEEPHFKYLGKKRTDGFYHIIKDKNSKGLFINYGKHKANARLSPVRLIRDYLVEVEPAVYLGKAYFQVFSLMLPVAYFVLCKYQKLEEADK